MTRLSFDSRRGVDGIDREEVELVSVAVVHVAEAFEVPPRVGPVQRRGQSLPTEEQLLPTVSQSVLAEIGFQEREIDEGVLDVPAIHIDRLIGSFGTEAVRVNAFDVGPEAMSRPLGFGLPRQSTECYWPVIAIV